MHKIKITLELGEFEAIFLNAHMTSQIARYKRQGEILGDGVGEKSKYDLQALMNIQKKLIGAIKNAQIRSN